MNPHPSNRGSMSEDFGGCVLGSMAREARREGHLRVDGKGWIDTGYCSNQSGLSFIICLRDFIWIASLTFDFQTRGVHAVQGHQGQDGRHDDYSLHGRRLRSSI